MTLQSNYPPEKEMLSSAAFSRLSSAGKAEVEGASVQLNKLVDIRLSFRILVYRVEK